MLANKLKVGWHVDFFERLKGLLCTVKGGDLCEQMGYAYT